MNFNPINKIASSLSQFIDDNEKIALAFFARKLQKASEAYPSDKTIGQMVDIVSKMSQKNLFITKAEVKDLYNKLYTRNTKFAEVFKDEMGETVKLASAKTIDRSGEIDGEDFVKQAFNQVIDPALSNELNNAFGTISKGYSDKDAKAAQNLCANALYALNPNVTVESGNSDLIMVNASFETPKGKTNIRIPVKISSGAALVPSVFIGTNGLEDFSVASVKEYIVNNAGNAVKVSSYQGIEDASEIELPEYKDAEIESFAKALENPAGIAEFKFGKDCVRNGKTVIANHLGNYGFNNYQVSVCDVDDNNIFYAVAMNGGNVGFKVPVQIKNNKATIPSVAISSGSINEFSESGIKNIIASKVKDYQLAAVASPSYELKVSELVDLVKTASVNGKFEAAEEALNILHQRGNDKAYKDAFDIYMSGLNGKLKVEAKSKCSMVVKSANSTHLLCGHTNLPLEKVYQDKNGDCLPLHRKAMDDKYEAATFLNSKIFF